MILLSNLSGLELSTCFRASRTESSDVGPRDLSAKQIVFTSHDVRRAAAFSFAGKTGGGEWHRFICYRCNGKLLADIRDLFRKGNFSISRIGKNDHLRCKIFVFVIALGFACNLPALVYRSNSVGGPEDPRT